MADQPVRVTMTVKTAAMLTVNDLPVRQTMALLASGCRGVSPLMAICAVDAAMAGLGCGKVVCGLLVTNPALRVRHVSDRDDHQRLMGGMTATAIRLSLSRLVPLVAIQAVWYFLVSGMTAVAEQPGMPAGLRSHPLIDFAVT